MADVFISYSKAYRGLTQELAQELQDRGFSVWWDSDLLSGDRFREVILGELAQARAAIVIWTPASIKSDWVLSEATRARGRGILIPVRHADIAVDDIPPPFDVLHTEFVSNRPALYAALARLGVGPSATSQPRPVVSPSALSDAAVTEAVALAHWEAVKATSDPGKLREFLGEFGATRMAKLARNRLAELEAAAADEVRDGPSATAITIHEDETEAGGFAFIDLGRKLVRDPVKLSFRRLDGDPRYLGRDGWQGEIAWLEPDKVDQSGSTTVVRVGPAIVDRIDELVPIEIVAQGEPTLGKVTWPHLTRSPRGIESLRIKATASPVDDRSPVSVLVDPPAVQAVTEGAALEHWQAIKGTADRGKLHRFLAEFGATTTAKQARKRLAELDTPLEPAPKRRRLPLPVLAGAGVLVLVLGGVAIMISIRQENSRPALTRTTGPQTATPAETRPGQTLKECETCPEMVAVPAESFTMGSPTSEEGRSSNEGPQHRVTFAKAFAVGRFAVSFDEWDACVAGGGCNGYRPSDAGWGRGRRPVINVSWDDAKTYIAWLSIKTGKTFRLLSEAEREYVTRAGTTTPFWFGASISTAQANYNGNFTYGSGKRGEDRQQTLPVDSFEPNPWGFYQVHGNVQEWVEDCHQDSYKGAPSDGSARTTGDCSSRVVRGGSWDSSPQNLRSAYRSGLISGYRFYSFGFRVGRTLTP